MQKNTNILVCGIGGQGVMTATEILAEAALALGFDAKKTEVAGMSQRGGVVVSHLRFGEQVLSPQIAQGEADLLVGFEAAETCVGPTCCARARRCSPTPRASAAGGGVACSITRMIRSVKCAPWACRCRPSMRPEIALSSAISAWATR